MDISVGGGMKPGGFKSGIEGVEKLGLDSGPAGKPALAPAGDDVAKFGAAMNQPPVRETATPGLGDQLVEGLGNISDRIQFGRREAMDVFGKDNLSQMDLLKAQFAMNEAGNLTSLAGKVSEKITQAVKQLQQG
ncbi:MAG: hypothetical protein LBU23_06695 [Planctomycetota bacterium]|jgi:hypothetical protein|nr:hypothetical protein [Planctomycetota bacterium]